MHTGLTELKKPVAIVLLALSGHAMALGIGALQVDSHLGEAFKASVRIALSPEETLEASCVSLDPAQDDAGIFQLKHAKLELEDSGRRIRITTDQRINEPILTLKLDIHCGGEIEKSFTVFLDPPTSAAPPESPVEKAVPEKPAQKPSGGTTLKIKPHDTLTGIAHAFFPDDGQARKRFIASILKENPGISPDLIQVGSLLNIPDLKSTGAPGKSESIARKVSKPAKVKPAFHLDIVSGEAKSAPSDDLKRTETQIISRADDQAVQMLQLKAQIKTLEGKLVELQSRIATTNRLLAGMNAAKPRPREEAKPLSNLVWIVVLLVLMGIGGIVYWYFMKKKAEQDALLDQYLNPAHSKPALIDHLDYFESDTPDHHKW